MSEKFAFKHGIQIEGVSAILLGYRFKQLAFSTKSLIMYSHGWHETFCRMYIILVAGFENGAGRQRGSVR